jgi:hypothetical protein
MSVLDSVASHIRAVESRSIVAVSLLESDNVVVVWRCDHKSYVCDAAWYSSETSCTLLLPMCSRT